MRIGESRVVDLATTTAAKMDNALSESKVVGFGRAITRRTGRVVRNSYSYQWLTKEPNQEVIVIDLRESFTFGPFVVLLDRISPHIERAWNSSYLNILITKTFNSVFEQVTETQAYALVAKLLEPPQPSESRTGDDKNSSKED